MRILFDQGTPVPLRTLLTGHTVDTAFNRGWATLANGELLQAADDAGFALLVTTDQHLQYQQNLSSRQIAVLVLTTTSWPRIRDAASLVLQAINDLPPSGFVVVEIPARNV